MIKAKPPKTGDKSASNEQKAATTAHLLETTAHQAGHTKRHLESLKTAKNPKAQALDHEHAMTHMNGTIEHVQKLMDHVKSNYPAEGKELDKLQNTVPHTLMGRMHQAVTKHKGK